MKHIQTDRQALSAVSHYKLKRFGYLLVNQSTKVLGTCSIKDYCMLIDTLGASISNESSIVYIMLAQLWVAYSNYHS